MDTAVLGKEKGVSDMNRPSPGRILVAITVVMVAGVLPDTLALVKGVWFCFS